MWPHLYCVIETLDIQFEEESPDPDEEFLDPDEKKLLKFTVTFPINEKVVTQLIEIFRKKRVRIRMVEFK